MIVYLKEPAFKLSYRFFVKVDRMQVQPLKTVNQHVGPRREQAEIRLMFFLQFKL